MLSFGLEDLDLERSQGKQYFLEILEIVAGATVVIVVVGVATAVVTVGCHAVAVVAVVVLRRSGL